MKNQQVKKGDSINSQLSKRLYTLKEASVYLGRGLHGVRDMIHRGELPVIKGRRKDWVDVRDLETWVEKKKEVFA